MRFRTKMFALKPGGKVGEDDYGDPIYGPAVRDAFYGELQPVTGVEITEAAAQVVTRFKMFCPATLDVTAYDSLEFAGEQYQVTGPPEKHMIGGRVDHIEAYVERVTG